jgi:hypothetical protein
LDYNPGVQAELRQSIEKELKDAQLARLNKNEGRARVCARRAAGIAARDFLSRQGVRAPNNSAYETLKVLAAFPGLAMELRQAAEDLTARVSENFTLPGDIDLIAEARKLIGGLQ